MRDGTIKLNEKQQILHTSIEILRYWNARNNGRRYTRYETWKSLRLLCVCDHWHTGFYSVFHDYIKYSKHYYFRLLCVHTNRRNSWSYYTDMCAVPKICDAVTEQNRTEQRRAKSYKHIGFFCNTVIRFVFRLTLNLNA